MYMREERESIGIRFDEKIDIKSAPGGGRTHITPSGGVRSIH